MFKKIPKIKMNKKIILISALFLLFVSGIVLANPKNNQQENKDLLKEFTADGIISAQIKDKSQQKGPENYDQQESEKDNNEESEEQKWGLAQKIDLVASIGKNFFGIEKKKVFSIANKIVEIKSYKAPKTIDVPADYATIQEAINNAQPGDTIKVASGEYKENIIMKEGVSLIGSNEFRETETEEAKELALKDTETEFIVPIKYTLINETIINGSGTGNVISFKNGITDKTKLSGFTIKNSGKNLSGVFIENSSPIINDNIIEDNEYGAYMKENSSPVIQKNIMRFNNKGVQVYNFDNQEGELEATLRNVALGSAPTLTDNLITDNKIGVDLYNSSAIINHNTISYNNHYKTYIGATHGIYLSKSSAEIKNNIITDSGICDLCSGINADEKSENVIIAYNNIWNNKNNFVCFGKCEMQDNNLSEDPEFINPVSGNFRLKEKSKLIGKAKDGLDMGVRW